MFCLSRSVSSRFASCIGVINLLLAFDVLCVSTPLSAQYASGVWVGEGPAPIENGQVENIVPDNEVVGAIHAVVAHPTDPDIIYIGAVNGGVWKTSNATATYPSWIPLTDASPFLSISALEYDWTDPARQTLWGGTGAYSAFYNRGLRTGLLTSSDGGQSWIAVEGNEVLRGKTISGIAANSSTIVVSTNNRDSTLECAYGVFRSTDAGTTFNQLLYAETGFPIGSVFDLVRDPSNSDRLFAGVVKADNCDGAPNGVYRSDDFGSSWVKVSNSSMDTLITSEFTRNIEFAVGPSGVVWSAIVNRTDDDDTLHGVFRSPDQGSTWSELDLPGTIEEDGVFIGIHPGGQGSIHLSIVADPSDPNIVYIGGDRQGFVNGTSSIGARRYTGRLFRGDASQPSGSQFVHLTHSSSLGPEGGGTASGSSPHADSREMTFDAAGDLLEVDDGGIYRRTSPRDNSGDWHSINGDLGVTEMHSSDFDSKSGVLIGGAQDTGSSQQVSSSDFRWEQLWFGDGGDVAVDAISTPGHSTRFSSGQFLQGFSRRVYDEENTLVSVSWPALEVVDGGSPLEPQFVTPLRVNSYNGNRLVFGGDNSVYESTDQGDTIREVSPGARANRWGRDAIAYGANLNQEVLWVGARGEVFVRDAAWPAPLEKAVNYQGGDPVGIVTGGTGSSAWVADSTKVWRTTDMGESWEDVSGNLGSQDPGSLGGLAVATVDGDSAVVVGGNNGVYFTTDFWLPSPYWEPLGSGLPRGIVSELFFDQDSKKLFAAILGRGAWSLQVSEPPASCAYTVDSPNGGETWTLGQGYTIRWSSSGDACDAQVSLGLYTGASQVEEIASCGSSPNDEAHPWTIPATLAEGTDYRVRVVDCGDASYGDYSNANFTIQGGSSEPCDYTVTTPNGGEQWSQGQSYAIEWSKTGGDCGSGVKLELLKSGNFYAVIDGNAPSDEPYLWTVPSNFAVGSDYKVRLRDLRNGAYTDRSNRNFSIQEGSGDSCAYTVDSPNGGETWTLGQGYTIRWSSSGDACDAQVSLGLYTGASQVEEIASCGSSPNDEAHPWTIPATLAEGTDYRVRVVDCGDASYGDYSNANFTIQGGSSEPCDYTVTTPNGGEQWSQGQSYAIEWSKTGGDCGSGVKLELLKSGNFYAVIDGNAPSDEPYLWTVPSNFAVGSDYKVRLRDLRNGAYTDRSNRNFSIQEGSGDSCAYTVDSPNGGETWTLGQGYTIRWSSSGDACDAQVSLGLYTGASQVEEIASCGSSPNDEAHPWTIPATLAEGTDYRVRVVDCGDASYGDYSNANFTIQGGSSEPCDYTVTTPNGGEQWSQGQSYAIEWSKTGGDCGSGVKLELLKSGNFYAVIDGNAPSDEPYLWTVPSNFAVGSDYKVRLRDLRNGAYTDRSNRNFSIQD